MRVESSKIAEAAPQYKNEFDNKIFLFDRLESPSLARIDSKGSNY